MSKAEFKFFLNYLRQYYEYWMMFRKLDQNGDRRVSPVEFNAALPLLKKWGVPVHKLLSRRSIPTLEDSCCLRSSAIGPSEEVPLLIDLTSMQYLLVYDRRM